jgi:hypothetical protein
MVHLDNFITKNSPISEDAIIERIQTNITDGDLKRYFGDGVESKIIKYSNLADYNTIDELLPNKRDFRIILIEERNNVGHWCVVLKYDKTIEWYNPYSGLPDNQKNMLGKIINKMMGQDQDFLKDLMIKSTGYKLVYNKHRNQKMKNGINTCGRWCILRIICMKDLMMNLTEFNKMIKTNQKETGLPKDALVSIWIG